MGGESQPLRGGGDGHLQSSILGAPRQRRILAMLRERSRPVTVDECVGELAATQDGPAAGATEAVRTDLRHRCLPKLEAGGWIERRPEGIVAADPLPIATVPFSIPDLTEPDHPSWPVVSALLERPYRRGILSILGERCDRTRVDVLAAELRTWAGASWATSTDCDGSLATTLHHVDLPKLAAIGVVEYDPDARTIGPTRRLRTCLDQLELDVE